VRPLFPAVLSTASRRSVLDCPAAAAAILLTAAGCAGTEGPASRDGEGGLAGTGIDLAPPASPTAFTSPKGRRVRLGEVDELGWVLPLDIKRPRPEWPEVAPLPAAALGGPIPGPYPETRLGPDDGHSENETSIDALGSTVVAGWNQFTDTTLLQGVARSGDGGETWAAQTLGGHDVMSDPVVAAAGAGRWYFGYIARGGATGSDVDVFVRRSLDDGVTWQPPVPVTADDDFDDKPYLDARGDEVLVAYADFGFSPAKVRAARSLDGGLSFGADTVLADLSVGGNGASPVIGIDGTYYVFWRDSFQEFLWMSRSTDQGANWSQDAPVAEMSPLPPTFPEGFRIVNLPSAAQDPVTGTLLVVWNDQLFGDPDILAVRSTDGGDTWSLPVQVNDDGAGAAQFFPWITFDEGGTGWVVWYDRRHDPAGIDVYVARTDDGGASFGPNLRVTGAPFTPVLPVEPGALAFIGDYNGIAAAGGRVFPFYQDARRGEQDVWVARIDVDSGEIFRDGFESGDTSGWSAVVP
jgi:hypothetical protein